MSVEDRLREVRAWMMERGVEALVVPTSDPHGSEYLAEHWQCRRWLTGFTGSAGTAVVTASEALLWTDSRYWLQAGEQLAGTGFGLMREGVDVGIDVWLRERGCTRVMESYNEPFDVIWRDRPALPCTKAWVVGDDVAGVCAADKLARLEDWLREVGRESIVINDLAEIAWLLNIRGNDIAFNPFVISFFSMSLSGERVLYVESSQVADIMEYLESLGVSLGVYDEGLVKLCDGESPIGEWKACKNVVEREGFREAHVRDGVAMVQFLADLRPGVSELGVDRCLTGCRRAQRGFLDLSFETIAGYGAHGAIVHYEASEESDVVLGECGLLLLDSGAHYDCGTTDITRTVSMGGVTEEERRVYTLVLKGHLQLQNAVFPRGTTGLQLDTLARSAMWREGYDFGHGTGHGVGHILGVHEGPVQIRKNCRRDTVLPVVEGHVITDEPGIYVEGRFGVRIENCLLCVADRRTGFGDFLRFEPLTLCPYDRSLIDKGMLTEEEIGWVNDYHRRAAEVIMPRLESENHKVWLAKATAEL